MALGITIAHSVPIVGTMELDAYVRVASIHSTKESCTAIVSFLMNDEGRQPIKQDAFVFQPDMNGENFIRQAYLHLKSLPEFASATDC